MPMAAIQVYLERLPGLLAEWQLRTAEVASIPHLERNDRVRMLRSWSKEIDVHKVAKPISKKSLIGLGIAVVIQKANEKQ
jgi:hypothetical protein